jgi:dUTP pyrophosphatase
MAEAIISGDPESVAILTQKQTLKFKKLHPDAVIPKMAHKGDSGYDIIAIDDGTLSFDDEGNLLFIQYHTGLSVEPPVGFRTELWPRSSISKYHLTLANSIGLVDSIYTGELLLRFKFTGCFWDKEKQNNATDFLRKHYNLYKKGDAICQLVINLNYIFETKEVEELSDTERGSGNFGSTG